MLLFKVQRKFSNSQIIGICVKEICKVLFYGVTIYFEVKISKMA